MQAELLEAGAGGLALGVQVAQGPSICSMTDHPARVKPGSTIKASEAAGARTGMCLKVTLVAGRTVSAFECGAIPLSSGLGRSTP